MNAPVRGLKFIRPADDAEGNHAHILGVQVARQEHLEDLMRPQMGAYFGHLDVTGEHQDVGQVQAGLDHLYVREEAAMGDLLGLSLDDPTQGSTGEDPFVGLTAMRVTGEDKEATRKLPTSGEYRGAPRGAGQVVGESGNHAT